MIKIGTNMNLNYSLVAIGDNVVDNYMDRGEFYPGGNAVNVAVLTRRYGLSKTAYIGIFGNDSAGDHVKASLTAEGVNIDYVRTAIGENGKAFVTLNDDGDRVFGESNKGGVQSRLKLNFHPSDLEFIADYDLVHTSIYSYINDDLPLLAQYADVSYDFSVNRKEEILNAVCPYVKYAFFSCSDLNHHEAVAFGEHVHSMGPRHVLITRGEQGAIYVGDLGIHSQDITPVLAVDTLGAGDSYISGFLVSMAAEESLSDCMQAGAAAAAETCMRFGAYGYANQIG